ncbi:MAG: DMT family transporter [Eubacteriales bacterium]|nr:DMT family transporter [Eubacteriales bacterium]
MKSKSDYFALVFLSFVWAGHLTLVRVIGAFLPVNTTGACVRAATCIILTAALAAAHRLPALRIASAKIGLLLVCVGGLGFLLDFFSFLGLTYADSNTGTALLKTDVLFSALLTALVFKKGARFRPRDWGVTLAMLFGVLLILDIDLAHLHWKATDFYFILSALFVTLNAFLIQHLQHRHGLSNDTIAFYNNLFTMLIFAVFALMFENGAFSLSRLTLRQYLPLLAAGATQSLIYLYYYRSLSVFPVWFVKSILLLMPVFSMVINFLAFQTIPTPQHLLGTAIVVGCAAHMLYAHRHDGREDGTGVCSRG